MAGRAASIVSASPPTKKVSWPAAAAARLPPTGASRKRQPRSCALPASSRTQSGVSVLELDQDRARLRALERARGPEPDGARGVVVRDHRDNDVSALRRLTRRRGDRRALGDKRLGASGRAIPNRERKALLQPIRRHAGAHRADPEKGDALHFKTPIFCEMICKRAFAIAPPAGETLSQISGLGKADRAQANQAKPISLLSELTKVQSAGIPAVRRRRSGRPQCANSGRSLMAKRTRQFDPKHAFKVSLLNGREGRESGHRRYVQEAPGPTVREKHGERASSTLCGR